MLIQFSVENFMSFKNKAILSLSAGNDTLLPNNVFKEGKDSLLKSVAIYGANASGKSSLFRALTASILLIRTSENRQVGEKLLGIVPFKFDKKCLNKPSKFEYIFISNGIKYIYGFSATIEKVIEEYLYVYTSAKPSLVFKRDNVTNYKFPKKDESVLKELKKKNIDNKLFLCTATSWNYKETLNAYQWFSNKIDTYKNNNNLGGDIINRLKNDPDGSLKRFVLKLLKNADISIVDYEIKSFSFDVKSILPSLPYGLAVQLQNSKEKIIGTNDSIITKHVITNEKGVKEEFELDINEESDGTQAIFFFSCVLRDSFKSGKVVAVDEIERSLHPLLTNYIVSLFNNSEVNANNSQLIYTTHDTYLLDLETTRRDQIYMMSKEEKDGISELYSLDEFSVRKTENIQKAYLLGRYGAIPNVNMEEDLCK